MPRKVSRFHVVPSLIVVALVAFATVTYVSHARETIAIAQFAPAPSTSQSEEGVYQVSARTSQDSQRAGRNPAPLPGTPELDVPIVVAKDEPASADLVAANITVTTANDTLDAAGGNCASITAGSLPGPDGLTSLREAICATNSGAGGDTIIFSAALNGTPITLSRANSGGLNEDANSTGDLDITKTVTINGNGAANTIIQAGTTNANGIDKVFAINPICTTSVSFTMNGITVRNGRNTQVFNKPDFSFTGGGIDFCTPMPSTASLTITNSTISDNTNVNGYGGGMNIDSNAAGAPAGSLWTGTVTLTGDTFQNNKTLSTTTVATGGAINDFGSAQTVNITNTQFIGNSTAGQVGDGGALRFKQINGGAIGIHGSTFNANLAGGNGGAVDVDNIDDAIAGTSVQSVTIDQGSAFTNNVAGNTAGSNGGGGAMIVNGNVEGTTTVTKSIFTGNSYGANVVGGLGGGAILVEDGDLVMHFSRLAGNLANGNGAGGSNLRKFSGGGGFGHADVANNWWGTNNPSSTIVGTSTCPASGVNQVCFDPFIVLTHTPGASPILINQSTTLTADMSKDNHGVGTNLSGNLDRIVGLPITINNAVRGSLSGAQTTIQALGMATSTFQGTAAGAGSADAVVDSQTTTAAITISKGNTTASLTSQSSSTTVTGESYTVNFSAAPSNTTNSPTAMTGNVQVSDGSQTCTGAINASGTGSCLLTSTSAGAKTLTATYQGDANFNASGAAAGVAHTVNKADTTTNITSDNPDASVVNQVVTIQFNVGANSPGSGTPTGNVTVTDGTNSCTATNAVGQCTITYATPGPRTLTATYVGDSNYNASPASSGASHTVNQANTTAAITSDSPDPTVAGQTVAVSFTVTGSSGNSPTVPTGNVTVSDGVDSCIGTVAAGTCNVTLTTAGARTLTATYAGDTNFNASPASAGASHTVSNTAVWNGSTSSNWNTPANWTTNFVPTSTNDVSLPAAGVTNQPNLSAQDTTVNSLTVASGRSLTIAGGHKLTINGVLTMNGNNIDDTAGSLELGNGATITRTSGTILGSLKKDFLNGALTEGADGAAEPAADGANATDAPQVTTFTYPVGTAAGIFEVQVTPTATSTGTLTIQNFDGNPTPTSAATTLQRFWTTSSTGTVQADVKFFFHATTTPGTVANYRELRVIPVNQVQSFPNGAPCPGAGSPCFDNTGKTIFVAGATSFNANWTAGEPLGTTAAHVAVSGRVFSAEGRALGGARVTLDDGTGNPMTVITNAFGYYHFDAVQSGGTYMLGASARGYTFSPRVVPVTDQLSDLDLTALP